MDTPSVPLQLPSPPSYIMAQISQYSSSDDEAPEEESFQVSQSKSKSQNAAMRKTLDAANSIQKQKRRQKDQLLKQHKKKLLSEILAEKQEPEDESEDEKPRQQIKVVQHKVQKLEAEKDGFTLKVVKKSTSKLPPAKSSSLVSRKERFLARKRR